MEGEAAYGCQLDECLKARDQLLAEFVNSCCTWLTAMPLLSRVDGWDAAYR